MAMSLGPIAMGVAFRDISQCRAWGCYGGCTGALWVASFLLTYTFPFLNSGLGTGGTFLLYTFICLLGFLFTLKYIPETKGKSLEDLEKELVK